MHTGVFVFVVTSAVFVAADRGFAAAPPPSVVTATNSEDHVPPSERPLSKQIVAARLGMPSQIVSPELWIYREFYTDHQGAAQRGFDTLVIVFVGDRVDKMRLVNGEELTALLEANRRAQATSVAVATSPVATH
jgi:hypothetical protein